jgi:hypothetical protein
LPFESTYAKAVSGSWARSLAPSGMVRSSQNACVAQVPRGFPESGQMLHFSWPGTW